MFTLQLNYHLYRVVRIFPPFFDNMASNVKVLSWSLSNRLSSFTYLCLAHWKAHQNPTIVWLFGRSVQIGKKHERATAEVISWSLSSCMSCFQLHSCSSSGSPEVTLQSSLGHEVKLTILRVDVLHLVSSQIYICSLVSAPTRKVFPEPGFGFWPM